MVAKVSSNKYRRPSKGKRVRKGRLELFFSRRSRVLADRLGIFVGYVRAGFPPPSISTLLLQTRFFSESITAHARMHPAAYAILTLHSTTVRRRMCVRRRTPTITVRRVRVAVEKLS